MKDIEIREILRETSLKKYIYDTDSKVVDELHLPITKSRIDIAVVNGRLHGYEIKSSSDNLLRLSHQIEGYSKVFDYLTVVTEQKHLEKVLKEIPNWVGIKVCIGNKIKTVQKSYYNRNKEGFFVAKLLRRSEIEDLLIEKNISFRKKDTLWKLCEVLADNVSVNRISKDVRAILKSRQNWKVKNYYIS